jgi:hypothetical protein
MQLKYTTKAQSSLNACYLTNCIAAAHASIAALTKPRVLMDIRDRQYLCVLLCCVFDTQMAAISGAACCGIPTGPPLRPAKVTVSAREVTWGEDLEAEECLLCWYAEYGHLLRTRDGRRREIDSSARCDMRPSPFPAHLNINSCLHTA